MAAAAPVGGNIRVKILQEQGGRVSWLGRKNLIAFDAGGQEGRSDVYSAGLDGSAKRCLTCGKTGVPQLQNGNPEWHPSGDFIVFQAQDPDLKLPPGPLGNFLASPGIGINNNVWLMKADGSQFRQVTRVQNRGGTLHPQFSADGKKICWSEILRPGGRLGGQWAIKLGDFLVENGEPVVKNIQTLTPGSFELYETHGFSPDNQKLIFSVVPPGKYYFDMEIYTYDLSTQQAYPPDRGRRMGRTCPLFPRRKVDSLDKQCRYSPSQNPVVFRDGPKSPQDRCLDYEGRWVEQAAADLV